MERKIYAVWKNHEVVGYVKLSEEDAYFLNGIKDIGVYFGFDKTISPEMCENTKE